MSKRLPYYQSEPAEYLAGDIMFCSFSAQGVFSILRALYWQKDCKLNLTQAKKRIPNANKEFKELIDEDIIKVNNDNISIYFLDEQFDKATKKSNINSENGKKGAKARWRNNSESIATPLKKDGESMALREDKIIEDKKKLDIISEPYIKKKKDTFTPPTEQEFRKEAYEKIVQSYGKQVFNQKVKGNIIAKYHAWNNNDWKDGYNKPIKNWKAKLNHSLKHFLE